MPVEAITRKKLSKHSDVWSFGVTCWEIFTFAHIPYYELEDNKEVITFVVKGGRLEKPENCPNGVWTIISSCWSNPPHSRPSFDSLRDDFGALASGVEQTKEEPKLKDVKYD